MQVVYSVCLTCTEGEGLAGWTGAVPVRSNHAECVRLATAQATQGAVLRGGVAVLDVAIQTSGR